MKKFICLLFIAFAALCAKGEKFPIIFCQAQLKYPIASSASLPAYYSNWVDAPLLISSDYPWGAKGLGKEDFRFMREIARDYGFSAFGFWRAMIRTRRRTDFLVYAENEPLDNFRMVPIISCGAETSPAGFSISHDAPRLLQSPAVMEIYGKKLFWSYGVRKNSDMIKYRDGIRKYGKNFLIVQTGSFPRETFTLPLNPDGTLHPRAASKVRETVRAALDEFDGFAWAGMSTNITGEKHERIFCTARAKAVLKETAKVFAEPKYKGKIFGAAAVAEHTNAGRLGGTMTSDGTRTLRNSIITALDSGAQVINIPEWDEQNENTSLRPTVYNSFAYMRILRYITLSRRGEKVFHLAKDDLSIPNLIVSSRKSIVLGELLKIELLSIPDTADDKGSNKAIVTLHDPSGKEVYRSAELVFDRRKMEEHRLELASEKFSGIPALQLKLQVNGREYTGFTPIRLQSSWNNDYKYAKHPLRNLLPDPQIKFSVTPGGNGLATVSAEVDSPELIRFAEVVENGDPVYTHGGSERHGVWREDDKFFAFRVTLTAIIPTQSIGQVAITGTTPMWQSYTGRKRTVKKYVRTRTMHWFNEDMLRIDRNADPEKVVFNVTLNGKKSSFTLAQLLDQKTIMLPFPQGAVLTFTRQLRQLRHPANGDSKKISFTVPVMPDLAVSTYVLQLIGTDGKIYRSAPVILNRFDNGKKATVTVWSDSAEKPVTLTLPENFIPRLEYGKMKFTGIEEPTAFGRRFWGARGGFYNLANLRLGGGGSCSNGCSAGLSNGMKLWSKSPNLVPEKNGNVWKFKGGEHIALPPGVVPRRAGFTISFKIKPDALGREQFILGCRRDYVGVLSNLILEKGGTLHATYSGDARSRNIRTRHKLIPGRWNTVKIICDLKTITIEINGKSGKPVAIQAPAMYDMPTTIGCWELSKAFKGEISDLVFDHRQGK